MNVAAWMREARRLMRALYSEPEAHAHRSEVALTHHPEQATAKGRTTTTEYWSASCGVYDSSACKGSTPEEAAAVLVAKLEAELARRIASHRAELARLESSQAAKLRIVREEKLS